MSMIALRCTRNALNAGQLSSKRALKIYTKTGDKGKTSTYTGKRLPKDDVIFDAVGAVDSLSSQIGLSRVYCAHEKISQDLINIQCNLQDIGSVIATPPCSATPEQLSRVTFDDLHVTVLEQKIDQMTTELPPLTQFILPSGGIASAHLHVCRTTARTAERSFIPLHRTDRSSLSALRYLNRLSDYLFTAARLSAQHEGVKEEIYTKQ